MHKECKKMCQELVNDLAHVLKVTFHPPKIFGEGRLSEVVEPSINAVEPSIIAVAALMKEHGVPEA